MYVGPWIIIPTFSPSWGACVRLPMTGILKYDARSPTNWVKFSLLVCSTITVTLFSTMSEQNVSEISSNDNPLRGIVFMCSDILVKEVAPWKFAILGP